MERFMIITKIKKSTALIFCLSVIPFITKAAENEAQGNSYFSNALFNTLLIIIVLLAILIVALAGVLKNIAGSEMFVKKINEAKESKAAKKVMNSAVILFFFLNSNLCAATNTTTNSNIGGIDSFTFYTLLSLIMVEVIILLSLFTTINTFIKPEATITGEQIVKTKAKTILSKLSDSVEVENEETILLDHDYDGIKELDNNLPPWWKYGFYVTILVSVIYMINYHVTATSPLQAEEYKLSMKKAETEIAEYMKNSANNVDESTVKMLSNETDLAAGKEVFIAACSACHGKYGEGTVGPNLTDDYWLHSGSIKDIFKTIKYGYPDKGMKAWKDEYSPIQIAQLASYIKTLKGTNPPRPKEKQGDLYVEENGSVSDSTAVAPADSLQKLIPADTLQTKK